MTTGSIGSHRAFMGVALTLCACLGLVLFVGWRFYFEELHSREIRLATAAQEEAKMADLEKLGLMIDTPKGTQAASKSDATQLPLDTTPAAQPNGRSTAGSAASSSHTPAVTGATFPSYSSIKVLPLEEVPQELEQALALLDEYWAATDWRQKAKLVVDAERVKPLMEDYYEVQKASDPVHHELTSKARYSIDGVEILYFRYNGNRSTGALEVAMRRGSQSRFLLDWESLVGYGEKSFASLKENRPTNPVLLRVFARQFEYYNHEFADPARYVCVKMSSENGEQSIYGYAEKGTALADWLSTTLTSTGPSASLGFTVKVAYPPNAQSNQCVHLLQVLAARWIVLPSHGLAP